MKKNIDLTSDEIQMLRLYQALTLEQCVELFRKNSKNYGSILKTKLYIIIAAKLIYGEDYIPNKNYKKY